MLIKVSRALVIKLITRMILYFSKLFLSEYNLPLKQEAGFVLFHLRTDFAKWFGERAS